MPLAAYVGYVKENRQCRPGTRALEHGASTGRPNSLRSTVYCQYNKNRVACGNGQIPCGRLLFKQEFQNTPAYEYS